MIDIPARAELVVAEPMFLYELVRGDHLKFLAPA